MDLTPSHTFTQRIIGAARLDPAIYTEVEHDASATGQAALVVVAAALASAIGNVGAGGPGMVGALVGALFGWLLWSAVTYLIGARILGGVATWGELLRTVGFAHAPGILFLFAILPLVGWVVRFGVGIWMLVCGIVAIREALDVSTGKAVLTAFLGWLAMVILSMTLLAGTAGQGGFPFR